jgi:(5-formylfuran-3-yl)methyl phosphate synthase
MTRMLVSVRDAAEALLAIDAGCDLIDLKDPAIGALGALPPAELAAIVHAIRARAGDAVTVSATTGELSPGEVDQITLHIQAAAECGVDLLKVPIDENRSTNEAQTPALLAALAALPQAPRIVPVLIADRGIPALALQRALALKVFPALMLDVVDKAGGGLLWRHSPERLTAFITIVHGHGMKAGLAGALRAADVPKILKLKADFAGFRSAVCAGDRAGPIDAARVRAMRQRFGA